MSTSEQSQLDSPVYDEISRFYWQWAPLAMVLGRGHTTTQPSDALTTEARAVLASEDIDDVFGVKPNRVRPTRGVGRLGTRQNVSVAQREQRAANQANYD